MSEYLQLVRYEVILIWHGLFLGHPIETVDGELTCACGKSSFLAKPSEESL